MLTYTLKILITTNSKLIIFAISEHNNQDTQCFIVNACLICSFYIFVLNKKCYENNILYNIRKPVL